VAGRGIGTFAAVWAAGCGGGGSGRTPGAATGTPAAPPAVSRTAPERPSRTATGPAGATTAPVPPASSGGGAEPVRVPAAFTLRAGQLRPSTITVPPFLAIAVSVQPALEAGPRTITIRADRVYRLTVVPGRRAELMLPGQRAGSYAVSVQGGGHATLVVGGEPGP
jgi:hypothetical protein